MGIYVGDKRYAPYIGDKRREVRNKKALPYDAEVEYLESQGGCSIPTGVIPTGVNITIKTKIYYIGYSTNVSWSSWFLAYTDERSATYRIIRNSNQDSSVYINNSGKAGGGGTIATVAKNTLYDIEMYPGYCLINNSRIVLSTFNGSVNTKEMSIFGTSFKGRFYYFYMADGDNILLDCIPVRVGQVGYLYDKVSGRLFGNAGTGDFVLGPDKT